MEITIFSDRDGVEHKLTTESSLSSYGMPVYRIEDDSLTDYGPADMVEFAGLPVSTAGMVAIWARLQGRTDEEIKAAKGFLSQNPKGLQV